MNLLLLPRSLAPNRACARDADSLLVARAQAGEGAAFGLLLEGHRERVLNLAFSLLGSRADAEDAAQEAFVRAYESLGHFRGESQFGTWLYRIAVNVCLARLRRCKYLQAEDAWGEEVEAKPDAQNLAQSVEARAQVQAALGSLSPILRAVLILREMQGLSYQEIALILGVPIGTVRSRLSEARRLFRTAWEQIERGET